MNEPKPRVPVQALRPGDLLLHASKGEISKLIQWASDSDYSHIGMVFAPGLIAEAISQGVMFANRIEDRVQGIGEKFHFIDVMRPLRPEPLTPALVQALQDSARTMQGARFALNQMLQLGLICALRNKLPGDGPVQRLVGRLLEGLVRQNPEKLVCSEFIYLAYARAQTQPPGALTPEIRRRPLPDRPWPADFDIFGLLREYAEAQGKEATAVIEQAAALSVLAQSFEAPELTALRPQLLQQRLPLLEQAGALGAAEGLAGAAINPELTLPQDFRDSPSFTFLGTLVP